MNDVTLEKREADQGLDDLEKHAHRSLWGIGFFAFLMLFAYFVKFSGYGFSGKQEDWGVLGDYVGGLLNPVISLAALYWLTRSIVLQKRELKESREALRETAYSQSQQAKSSELSSQLQFISIEIGMIASKLSFEYEYRSIILKTMNGSTNESLDFIDKDGLTRNSEELLKETNLNIQRLTSSRDQLLNAAKKIDPRLTAFIQAAKYC